ncbi:TIGR03086 family metal-binding protein [Streptomyces sp. B6B3]|uniref:TIGR03086 family metal-binding protein n=1 Tax=Streptomyces sp. B6B3 TaxID=3153570 RepID=UPI00325C9694
MTTQQHMLDLEPVARELSGLLDGVADDQFALATPCENYTVAGLLRHLLGLTVAFRDAARKDLGPTTQTDPGATPPPPIPHDWRGELRRRLDELVVAWRDPAAWEGETQAGGVALPSVVAGQVALNEVLLHGWDLARATGQPYHCDEASARASIALLSQSASDAERVGTGFGPVVVVPDDAPPLDRAVALGGRSPSWSPPA